MKDEIKETLENIKCPQLGYNKYGKWGALPLKVRMTLKRLCDYVVSRDDYITNLQEENKNKDNEILELLQKNEKLKAYIKYLEEYKPNYYKGEKIYGIDYKSRIDKAKEYINHEIFKRTILVGVGTKKYTRNILDNVLNILNGGDE